MIRAALKILNWRHQYHVMSKLTGTPLVVLPVRSVDFREMYFAPENIFKNTPELRSQIRSNLTHAHTPLAGSDWIITFQFLSDLDTANVLLTSD